MSRFLSPPKTNNSMVRSRASSRDVSFTSWSNSDRWKTPLFQQRTALFPFLHLIQKTPTRSSRLVLRCWPPCRCCVSGAALRDGGDSSRRPVRGHSVWGHQSWSGKLANSSKLHSQGHVVLFLSCVELMDLVWGTRKRSFNRRGQWKSTQSDVPISNIQYKTPKRWNSRDVIRWLIERLINY